MTATKMVSIRLPATLVDRVDAVSSDLGVSRSQWFLRTVQNALEQGSPSDPEPYAASQPEPERPRCRVCYMDDTKLVKDVTRTSYKRMRGCSTCGNETWVAVTGRPDPDDVVASRG